MNSEVVHLFSAIPWFAWIAIVAIISSGIAGVVKMRYQHLERIEMIRQGMNPDAGKPAGVDDCA